MCNRSRSSGEELIQDNPSEFQDPQAFNGLAKAHRLRLLRFARALLPHEAAAEEVVQDALLMAFQGAASYRGEGSSLAWLMTITRRAAGRWRKQEGKGLSLILTEVSLESLGLEAGWGQPIQDPEEQVQKSEAMELLRKAIFSLPQGDQAILILRDIEGLSGPEAARVLDIKLSTGKTRLHRARLKLMAALRNQGGDHGSP